MDFIELFGVGSPLSRNRADIKIPPAPQILAGISPETASSGYWRAHLKQTKQDQKLKLSARGQDLFIVLAKMRKTERKLVTRWCCCVGNGKMKTN